MKKYIGEIGLFLTAIVWGMGFVGTKLSLDGGLTPLQLITIRFLIASIFINLIFYKRIKENISKEVFDELKLDDYKAELLPQDKVEIVEQIIKEKTESKQVAFIGDGINDAPVLALSDIGIAMGGAGSDAAIEAADIVIMTDEPSKLADAMKISKKTMKIVKDNIIFAITVKIVVLLLSALGLATMWAAVFADVGVSVIAILNALRILRVKNTYTK